MVDVDVRDRRSCKEKSSEAQDIEVVMILEVCCLVVASSLSAVVTVSTVFCDKLDNCPCMFAVSWAGKLNFLRVVRH